MNNVCEADGSAGRGCMGLSLWSKAGAKLALEGPAVAGQLGTLDEVALLFHHLEFMHKCQYTNSPRGI